MLVLALLILLGGPPPAPSEVWFNPARKVATPAEAKAALATAATDPDLAWDYASKDGRVTRKVTCANLAAARRDGLAPAATTNVDIKASLGFEADCAVQEHLAAARPAQTSALAGWTFSKDSLAELPACFDNLGEDGYLALESKAASAGTSWQSWAPSTQIVRADPLKLEVKGSWQLTLEARADMDGGGREEALIHVVQSADGGTWGLSSWALLTRLPGERVLRVVDGSWLACQPNASAPAPDCSGDAADAARAAFQGLFQKKSYGEAASLLQGFRTRCAKKMPLLHEGWIRSDLALADHAGGNDAACRAMLAEPDPADYIYSDPLQAALKNDRVLCSAPK
jgi:hypothetical protein